MNIKIEIYGVKVVKCFKIVVSKKFDLFGEFG